MSAGLCIDVSKFLTFTHYIYLGDDVDVCSSSVALCEKIYETIIDLQTLAIDMTT